MEHSHQVVQVFLAATSRHLVRRVRNQTPRPIQQYNLLCLLDRGQMIRIADYLVSSPEQRIDHRSQLDLGHLTNQLRVVVFSAAQATSRMQAVRGIMLLYSVWAGLPVQPPYLVHSLHSLRSPQLAGSLALNQPSQHQHQDPPYLDHSQASKLDHGQALNLLPRRTIRAFIANLRRQ